MSMEGAVSFWRRVEQDAALQSALSTAEATTESEAAVVVVSIARRAGYDFTPEELTAALQRSSQARGAELNDEQLEKVAGGLTEFSPLLAKLKAIAQSLLREYL
jgi:predicted ribosomally synthesized peptide with nif11-like leader